MCHLCVCVCLCLCICLCACDGWVLCVSWVNDKDLHTSSVSISLPYARRVMQPAAATAAGISSATDAADARANRPPPRDPSGSGKYLFPTGIVICVCGKAREGRRRKGAAEYTTSMDEQGQHSSLCVCYILVGDPNRNKKAVCQLWKCCFLLCVHPASEAQPRERSKRASTHCRPKTVVLRESCPELW